MSAKTHAAVVMVGLGEPLEIRQVPTPTPVGNEVRVHVEWTASTPFDMHQNYGGLGVNSYPQILGDGTAGTVVEVGPDVKELKVGDKVFGFTWRSQAEKAHQVYCVAPENLLGKVPEGFDMKDGVVLGNNFVTVFHAFTKDFGFKLPWPKPQNYTPPEADKWILVWGGSSSCGMYAIQVLKWYGYQNIITTASKAQHERLQKYGAVKCFDYREGDVIEQMQKFLGEPQLGYVLDCIGSVRNSVQPIAKIAQSGTVVALLLPVIVRDAAEGVLPDYSMGMEEHANWAKGVVLKGVRTHFYLDNPFLAEKLQSEIMPWCLANKVVEPNDIIIVEGKTMLERAQKAMLMLRDKKVSGGRLVWRVSDAKQVA